MPDVYNKSLKEITERVSVITARKTRDPQQDTIDLEREIDALVYDLYDLSASEVAAVEAS